MRKAISALPALLVAVALAQSPGSSSQHVVVRNVTLNGVTQLSAAEQKQIISRIQKSYGVVSFGHITDDLREAMQDHGFYKAAVAKPKVTVISGNENNGTVDVAFGVSEGKRYRLKKIAFTNNEAFSSKELRRQIPLEDGAVFSTVTARHGFEALRKFYVSHGYIDFVPFPELMIDERAALITMQIDLSEGVPFRVGTLAFDGAADVTPETTARLQTAWEKYKGRIYSGDVMPMFVRENAIDLPKNETEAQLFRIMVDEEAHVLHFRLELGGVKGPSPAP